MKITENYKNMKKAVRFIPFLIIALAIILFVNFYPKTAKTQSITPQITGLEPIPITTRIVWTDSRNSNDDIYLYDLSYTVIKLFGQIIVIVILISICMIYLQRRKLK